MWRKAVESLRVSAHIAFVERERRTSSPIDDEIGGMGAQPAPPRQGQTPESSLAMANVDPGPFETAPVCGVFLCDRIRCFPDEDWLTGGASSRFAFQRGLSSRFSEFDLGHLKISFTHERQISEIFQAKRRLHIDTSQCALIMRDPQLGVSYKCA